MNCSTQPRWIDHHPRELQFSIPDYMEPPPLAGKTRNEESTFMPAEAVRSDAQRSNSRAIVPTGASPELSGFHLYNPADHILRELNIQDPFAPEGYRDGKNSSQDWIFGELPLIGNDIDLGVGQELPLCDGKMFINGEDINTPMLGSDVDDINHRAWNVFPVSSGEIGINAEDGNLMARTLDESYFDTSDWFDFTSGGSGMGMNVEQLNRVVMTSNENYNDPSGCKEFSFSSSEMVDNAPDENSNSVGSIRSGIDCSGCNLVREVVHSNGISKKKLKIHRGIDQLYHVRIEEYGTDGTAPAFQSSNIELGESEAVKKFLTEYALCQQREGYEIIHDPIDDLIVELFYANNNSATTRSNPVTTLQETEFCETVRNIVVNRPTTRKKHGLSEQRKRGENLSISDLVDFIHLPIEDAAKELQLCTSLIKKTCRKHRIGRWPARKIAKIDNRISKLEGMLLNGKGKSNTLSEIEMLKDQRKDIYCSMCP